MDRARTTSDNCEFPRFPIPMSLRREGSFPMADSIATAADYADAIMTARRAKNTLFLLLLLILLAQLALFFLGRNDVVDLSDTGEVTAAATIETPTTTQPATTELKTRFKPRDVLEYLVGLTA